MNKLHKILIGAIFIMISLTGLIVGCGNSGEQKASQSNTAGETQIEKKYEEEKISSGETKVIVYYFHTSSRCRSCYTIEKYTKEAINNSFKDELSSGELTFKLVNIEEKGNEHFLGDYQLYTKSVVVSLVKDGEEIEFKNLKKVWGLLRNRDKFYKYIEEETRKILDGIKLEKEQ
jgi:hypothetical protein